MKKTVLATLVACAFAAPAFAGDSHAPAPIVVLDKHMLAAADMQADAWKRWADDFSHEMRASMGTMFAPRMSSTKLVKGAPYSAEVVTETTQSLADGNTISRKKSGMVYRDGEGRTRQETAADGKQQSIVINDPVEKKMYVLNPGSKSAVVMPRVTAEARNRSMHVYKSDGTEVRVEDGKVTVDGKEVAGADGKFEMTTKSGKKVVIDNGRITIDGKDVSVMARAHAEAHPGNIVIRRSDSGDGTQREEVRVQVIRSGDGKVAVAPVPPAPPVPPTPGAAPMPPIPPLPGIHTMHFESTAKLGKGATTHLGMKDFDGVKAEGKSTVWTIAAGEIGNRNPINITQETWYSPDLQVTVYSRYSDPRTGESVYKLANIRRAEPAADLFKVPEEYKSKNKAKEKAKS